MKEQKNHIDILNMLNMNQKLVIICHPLTCGGTEKVITKLASYFTKKGVNTRIITLGRGNKFDGFELSKQTKVIEIVGLKNKHLIYRLINIALYIYKLNKYFRFNKESIYLSFLPIPNIISLIACTNQNITLYASERVNPVLEPDLAIRWRLMRRLLYNRLDGLVVQTTHISHLYESFMNKDKVTVIPNSINTEKLINFSRHTYSSELRLLFLGRLEHQKGLDILLESLIMISKKYKYPPFKVNVVGSGSQDSLVKASINNNKLAGWVYLHKMTANPLSFIEKSDVIIHPSRYEGMSNVVLEGMACGKCVISSTNTSGSIITNMVDGVLLKDLNSKTLRDSLIYLNDNREVLESIGLNAIKKIKLHYSDTNVFSKWEKLLF